MTGRATEEFLEFIEKIDASHGGHASPDSGVGQNIARAIRPVLFVTDYEEYRYATHGGTLFVVEYEKKLYGLTCQHVFKDFSRDQLFVTNEKFAKKGSKPARLRGFYNPDSPRDGAEGTDIVDLCVVEFAEEVKAEFFGGTAYKISDSTIATSREGHALLIAGVLKEKTKILCPDIEIGYCRLQFQDAGNSTSDPLLRVAIAEFENPQFEIVTGVSGSPVFDIDQNRLCGMVLRGGMKGRRCRLLYLDIFDIAQTLKAICAGAGNTYYTKGVLIRTDEARGNFLDGGED